MLARGDHRSDLAVIILIFSLFSCATEDEPYDYSKIKPHSGELYLTEYREGDKPFYSFSYLESDLLESVTFHSTRSVTYTANYPEGETRPASFNATFGSNELSIELIYEENRLTRYRFTVNETEAFEVSLTYDSLGRIVRTVYSSDFESAPTCRDMEWEGGNIRTVKIYSENNPDVYPYRYEYDYDSKKNPFSTVYKGIGYNIAENFPLMENNWTELKIFEDEAKTPSFVVKNSHTYWIYNYPYDRITQGESSKNGKEDPLYSTFIYK